jgi:hypothetical protein
MGSHFKRARLHFSERQYLLKLYCMDIRLLVAIMDLQTSTLILKNFIRCIRARCKIKSVNGRILLDLALILVQLVKN